MANEDRIRQVVAAIEADQEHFDMLPAEPALSGDPEPWRSALLKSAAHMRGEAHAQ